MRSSIILATVLAIAVSPASTALAQGAPKPDDTTAARAEAAGEEGAPDVDPAVLDHCRRQAAEQKLTAGPERTAFMGTCVTPED